MLFSKGERSKFSHLLMVRLATVPECDGTHNFERYRYRYFFPVPNFDDTDTDTFFRYQILPIPIPILFSGTQNARYRFRYLQYIPRPSSQKIQKKTCLQSSLSSLFTQWLTSSWSSYILIDENPAHWVILVLISKDEEQPSSSTNSYMRDWKVGQKSESKLLVGMGMILLNKILYIIIIKLCFGEEFHYNEEEFTFCYWV